MVYVVALPKLGELFGCKGQAIFSIEQTRWYVLIYELLQACRQRLGRIGGDFIQKGVLPEKIAYH